MDQKKKRILIVKTSAIGDVIQSFPVIDYLKEKDSQIVIDWVVEKPIAALVKAHPCVHKVLEVNTKVWRQNFWKNRKSIRHFLQILRATSYDVLFDLQGNTKSGFITFFAKAKIKVGYAWKSVPEKLNVITTNRRFEVPIHKEVRKATLSLVQQFFEDQKDFDPPEVFLQLSQEEEKRLYSFSLLQSFQPKILVCFGSNWENKQLSEKTLYEFLHLVHKKIHPNFFFIFGNEKEKDRAIRLNELFPSSEVVGEMSLPFLQHFMRRVDLVFSMDSALLHLCGTTLTPSFSVFGPSSGFVYKPSGSLHVAYQGSCPYEEQFLKRCRLLRTCTTGACIKEIAAKDLFERFYNFWKSVSKSTPFSTI